MRTLLITEIPSAYRVDFFNSLAQRYKDSLHIAFVPTGRDPHKELIYVEGDEPFWQISTLYRSSNKLLQAAKLWKQILKSKPDKIIIAGFPPRLLPLSFYAKLTNTKLYTWFAGTQQSEEKLGSTRFIYRKIISNCLDGAVLYSDFSQAYLSQLNPKLQRTIVLGNNTRDSRHYAQLVDKHRQYSENKETTLVTVGFQTKSKNS